MARKPKVPAIAYLRTSSAANVGREKDSDRRQRGAITGYARRAGYEIIGEYYDAAISGADPIEGRPGFAALLERIEPHRGAPFSRAPASTLSRGCRDGQAAVSSKPQERGAAQSRIRLMRSLCVQRESDRRDRASARTARR